MLTRREARSRRRTSPRARRRAASRKAIGSTMWFETMVESAMAATITMEAAEEKPPRKARSARPCRPCCSGRVRTKRSGSEPAGRVRQPDERDRQDEERHAEEVEREEPGGGGEVPLVEVLHDRHLELPRQADHRGGGEEGHGHPARAEDVGPLDRRGGDAGEDRVDAPRDAPDREDADSEERHQLDHRLEGDGGDDAVVALVGVEVAGAEEDGEEREPGGDEEGRAAARGAPGDHLVAAGDRLELQRDVGGDRHDGGEGDEDGEARALAVARGDEVGDRGDAVDPADPHQLAQDEPPADEDQRRAEIDGDELEPRCAPPSPPRRRRSRRCSRSRSRGCRSPASASSAGGPAAPGGPRRRRARRAPPRSRGRR